MILAADSSVAFVALLHAVFMLLEMFLWKRPAGRRLFGLSREFSSRTAALAANQGLYNGFLAAGLVWGLMLNSIDIKLFFLACVIIAGLFGAFTVNRSIFWFQALPGAVALVLVLLSGTWEQPE